MKKTDLADLSGFAIGIISVTIYVYLFTTPLIDIGPINSFWDGLAVTVTVVAGFLLVFVFFGTIGMIVADTIIKNHKEFLMGSGLIFGTVLTMWSFIHVMGMSE